jgi:beta-lactamase superfamily II metal-dependent hydrolase
MKTKPNLIDFSKISSKVFFIGIIAFAAVFAIIFLGGGKDKANPSASQETTAFEWGVVPGQEEIAMQPELPQELEDSIAEIRFLNVGLSDSVLCKLPGDSYALIDAGKEGEGDNIVAKLKALGITKLDFLILSLPTPEYTGAVIPLLQAGLVDTVYMPTIPEDKIKKTKDYSSLMDAFSAHNTTVHSPDQGEVLYERENASITVLSDKRDWNALSSYSLVTRVDVGSTSFLMMGQAGEPVEQALHDTNQNVKANVLKLADHGSAAATTVDFIEKVLPQRAVISVKTNPSGRYPDEKILQRLTSRGIRIYQTDIDGDIVFQTNGQDLAVSYVVEELGDKESES